MVYERLFLLMENAEHYPQWRMDGLQFNTPDLIKVPFEQVSYIDSIFNSFQRLFPTKMSFAWTEKPDREGFFALLPLKTLHKLPLNQNTVKKSNIQNYSGHQELSIELHKEYIEEWARMTRNNIGRSLAIVMDGKVLMYPRVNDEIVGGRLTITGDFDNNELALMKSVILGGVLECKAQIINQEMK
jgi:SecD/SecF fusion protein